MNDENKAGAVRAHLEKHPRATPVEIGEALAGSGIEVSARYVSTIKQRLKVARQKSKRKKSLRTPSASRAATSREYPNASVEDTLILADAIQKHGAGQPMRRLTLCEKLGKSPESSATRVLITNSGKYGLTTGGYQADEIALTELGQAATDQTDPKARLRARAQAGVLGIRPFAALYEKYKGLKLPAAEVLADALRSVGLDAATGEQYAQLFIVNAKFVGLLQVVAGSERLLTLDHALDQVQSKAPSDTGTPADARPFRRASDSTPAAPTGWASMCFYISPIGEENSEHRKHADLFLGALVEPAAEKLGLSVVRADRIGEPGMITGQIIAHILNAGLVVADLSHHNPNVFYELCLRHATRKPTIHLCRRADRIPFDISQFRTIVIDTSDIYSLVPQIDSYRAEIVTQMRSAVGGEGGADNPLSIFAPGFRVVTAVS